jgi:hypothetical protein
MKPKQILTETDASTDTVTLLTFLASATMVDLL